MVTIKTEYHTDNDGLPSKKLIITDDSGLTITVKLGSTETAQLATALRPNAKNIVIEGGQHV